MRTGDAGPTRRSTGTPKRAHLDLDRGRGNQQRTVRHFVKSLAQRAGYVYLEALDLQQPLDLSDDIRVVLEE